MLKSGKNYYEILGVTPDIETAQLKAVYRRLARKFHPDINPDGEKMFKDITEAYEVLCDETKRRQYDKIGSRKREMRGDFCARVRLDKTTPPRYNIQSISAHSAAG